MNIKNIGLRTLLILDHTCDYIPFLSTITNTIDSIAKRSIERRKNTENIYFNHLKHKRIERRIVGCIPIAGNIALLAYDGIGAASLVGKYFISKFKKNFTQDTSIPENEQLNRINEIDNKNVNEIENNNQDDGIVQIQDENIIIFPERPVGLARNSKFQGLKKTEEILKKHGLINVKVPTPFSIEDELLFKYISKKHPEIVFSWQNLNEQYKNEHDKIQFLSRPDVLNTLKSIQNSIKNTFIKETEELETQELTAFIETNKENYLMVRSSGVEDSDGIVNAGGNLSESYIVPETEKALASVGNILASYFNEQSLRNQIQAGKNPFEYIPPLNVVLQPLIGEPINNNNPNQIPVSVVLFSTEPTYSQGSFKLMKLSSTWGHGEGVVNNEQIQTDTFYVSNSPGEDSVLEICHNQEKVQRLAPVQTEADQPINLIPTENPDSIRKQRTLNKKMIARLVEIGRIAEQEMGYPVDMELVVKGDVIYIVQMRKVQRQENTPTYLNDKKILKRFSHPNRSPVENTLKVKTLVTGKSDVLITTKKDETLFCSTLKQAESQFDVKKHKLIIVSNDEPANSHPVVNFSTLGIPCYFSPQNREITDLINHMSEGISLLSCPQSGRLTLWNTTEASPQDFIKTGYFSHPAPLSISLTKQTPLMYSDPVAANDSVFEDFESLIFQLKTAKNAESSAKIFQEIKETYKKKIVNIHQISNFEQPVKRSQSSEITKIYAVMQKMEEKINQTFQNLETAYTTEQPNRLEQLFHIKVLSHLLTSKSINGVNTYTLKHLEDLADTLTKLLDYEKRRGGQPSRFIHLLHIGNNSFTPESFNLWIKFLYDLEDASIEEADYTLFNEMLNSLHEAQALPTWFSTIFLNSVEQNSVTAFNHMIQNYKNDQLELKNGLDLIKMVRQGETLASSIGEAHKTDKIIEKMCEMANEVKKIKIHTPNTGIAKIIKTTAIKKYVDSMDLAIKNIKMEARFTDKEKTEKMNMLLKENYNVLKGWLLESNEIVPIPIEINDKTDINGFFAFLEECWSKADLLPDNEKLKSTPDFNVNGCIAGSTVNMSRHSPKTLEDIFTVIHQNQIFLITKIGLKNEIENQIKDVQIVNYINDEINNINSGLINAISNGKAIMDGFDIANNTFSITYHIPQNNHASIINLTHCKESKKTFIAIKLIGERIERYENVYKILHTLQDCSIINIHKIEKPSNQGLDFTLELKTKEHTDELRNILNTIIYLSNDKPYEYSLRFLSIKQLTMVLKSLDKIKEKNTSLYTLFNGLTKLEKSENIITKKHENNNVIFNKSIRQLIKKARRHRYLEELINCFIEIKQKTDKKTENLVENQIELIIEEIKSDIQHKNWSFETKENRIPKYIAEIMKTIDPDIRGKIDLQILSIFKEHWKENGLPDWLLAEYVGSELITILRGTTNEQVHNFFMEKTKALKEELDKIEENYKNLVLNSMKNFLKQYAPSNFLNQYLELLEPK